MYRHGMIASLYLVDIAAAATLGLTAQPFQVRGQVDVNNIKLAWGPVTTSSDVVYTISKSSNDAQQSVIANTTGDSFDDVGLDSGTTYTYSVASSAGDTSNNANATTFTPAKSYSTYTNSDPATASLRLKSSLLANGTYYKYTYESDNTGFTQIVQQTSTDGYDFSGSDTTTVLTAAEVCPATNSKQCKMERTSFSMNPATSEIVMWAHLENNEDYDLAYVASAHAAPGQNFTFDGGYRPLGHDFRDLGFLADDDGSAYLFSATNTNQDMNIYKLSANWTAVDSLVTTVLVGERREAPAAITTGGQYYLFTSTASGWYPSLPEYISSTSLSGPWSESAVISNTATFACQSGNVYEVGEGQYAMLADRWAANWDPADGPNVELMLPLAFEGGSVSAHFAYYDSVSYTDDDTSGSQGLYGVQAGTIVSQGKDASASAGSNITFANDGTADDSDAYFVPDAVPFYYQIDLGDAVKIVQTDMTTRLVQGSETYYQGNVTGSADNSTFSLLADFSDNTQVGFLSNVISDEGMYRYVRWNVERVINTNNGNEADFAVGVIEATVYAG